KHVFYTTGDSSDAGMIAFWDIHDPEIGTGYSTDINAATGLPWWVNHVAFDAPTREALDAHRRRWQEHGHRVLEVDHEFCVSIYLRDPSENLVEFCHTTRPFTAEEKIRAVELMRDPAPELDGEATFVVHDPTVPSSA
ncbi:MAG: VOC family protein, partial [Ilumatobacteraceae bacterium]